MATTTTPIEPVTASEHERLRVPRRPAPLPPRRRRSVWAWLTPAAIGAVIAGFAVSDYYETATLGERVDATMQRGENTLRGFASDMQRSADRAVESGTVKVARVASSLTDAGITANIKTALAADPALSAMKIDVTTRRGVVTLSGPAPNADARERATVLARAPEGVTAVQNELVLPTAVAVTAPAAQQP